MHRKIQTRSGAVHMAVALALLGWALCAQAQSGPVAGAAAAPVSLKAAFDAAWTRQPEALALPARRDAVRAAQQSAQAWTPEPAALEVTAKTDRLNRNQGAREAEVGVVLPLWLPGERARSQAVAEAEGRATESRATAAQLRVAAGVREAWWSWHRAAIEAEMAREQLLSVRRIAADVGQRQRAGDLARADQHQAEGAVASAESTLAQAEAALAIAGQHLQAITGLSLSRATSGPVATAEPESPDALTDPPAHAALAELQDQAELARRSAALASTQSRANPELSLAVTRERSAFGEATQQSLTLGLRIPFGAGARHAARVASARADSTEAEARLSLERERLLSERDSANARMAAARAMLAAAERRAQLAAETRGFFDKSFRLGETDLPTRLRIEAEATEAGRQAALARINLATAVSAQRQALGLLPQ